MTGASGTAFADDRDRYRDSDHREKKQSRSNEEWSREHYEREDYKDRGHKDDKGYRSSPRIIHRVFVYVLPPQRVRHYRV